MLHIISIDGKYAIDLQQYKVIVLIDVLNN